MAIAIAGIVCIGVIAVTMIAAATVIAVKGSGKRGDE